MTVLQGLTSITNTSPNFTNKLVQDAIDAANIGFVTKTKTLSHKADINTVLTDTQKNSLKSSMNVQAYLSVGRYLQDLENHTNNILNGTLFPEETVSLTGSVITTVSPTANLEILDSTGANLKTVYGNDPAGSTSVTVQAGTHEGNMPLTFLEYLGQVQAVQSLHLTLYGTEASSSGKGVDDYFGSLRGTMNDYLNNVKNVVQSINGDSLATDVAYQAATQNLINFIDSLGDSTYFDESTYNSLLSAFETAANNFNSSLSATIYTNKKFLLVAAQSAISSQITTEYDNLESIKTYSDSLANMITYQGLASNDGIRDLISKSSQSYEWQDYFGNYTSRYSQQNPLYNNSRSDSDNSEIINTVLRLRGLPDVKDYVDIDAVATKAQKDVRLRGILDFSGKTTEQIIRNSCEQLKISILSKDVYALSKSLLENMNNNDREIIKNELSLHQQINTLS